MSDILPPPATSPGDVHVHEITYFRFMLAIRWIVVWHAGFLSFLVLYFCTSASFLTAAVVGLALLALGVRFLIMTDHPPKHAGDIANS